MRLPGNFHFFVLAFLTLAFFASCSDDDDNSTNGTTTSNEMSASISGFVDKNFDSDNVIFMVQDVGGMSQTVITGYEGNQQASDNIMIQLINLQSGPSTIDLSNMMSGMFMFVSYVGGSATQITATEGEVIIIENTDSQIKGTFHAKLGSSGAGTLTEITNGSFSCKKK